MPSGFSPLQQHLAELLAPLIRALRFLVDPLSPLYWPYLLGGLLFALFAWWVVARRDGQGLAAFLREHFGRALWWHPSARVDYRFYLVNALIYPLLFAPLLWWGAALADLVRGGLLAAFDEGPRWAGGLGAKIAYTLLFFVVYDFGRWLAHTALHDIPVLWAFHQVHHSAQVLTPVTAFRVHPVDLVVTNGLPLLLTGLVTGVFSYLFKDAITAQLFLGSHLLIAVTGLIANLKHSHIWLGYGPLNGWWISPAHHQLHHSAEERHWGKNRGFELAVWDRLAGSLLIPSRQREIFAMGLGGENDDAWHHVRRLYAWPFRDAWRVLRRR